MSRDLPEPMRLKPRRPPGHAKRKALEYAQELHRLRAEGYTLESIRQALSDVGVSVSLSAIRRELARPPRQSEVKCAQDVAQTLEEFFLAKGALGSEPSQPLDASRDPAHRPADGEPVTTRPEAISAPTTSGAPSTVVEILRRIGRAWRFSWR